MASRDRTDFIVVGAGAAGLIAARELARAGRRVTILEARDRCGGRILTLPEAEFGYPAEGGPEFVHGAAPVTRAAMREAGLRLQPRGGSRWSKRSGTLRPDDSPLPHAREFYDALTAVEADLPVADFLDAHFAAARYAELHRSITRTVEGYDAADPKRMSTLALRAEWMARDEGEHGRIAGGYGALIDHLARDCRHHGAAIHLGAAVAAIEISPSPAGEGGPGWGSGAGVVVRCRNGTSFAADAAIISVPVALLPAIALPASARRRADAATDIGYGNVVKLLLRFRRRWWAEEAGGAFADLSFVLSNAAVPTWWTQHPDPNPVLTGWYAGPKADRVSALSEDELVAMGLASLADIFELPAERLNRDLVAQRALNWGNDPYARGAYSYATPETRAALAVLKARADDGILFTGEALYEGPDMGTVEAALASGQETAQAILAGSA